MAVVNARPHQNLRVSEIFYKTRVSGTCSDDGESYVGTEKDCVDGVGTMTIEPWNYMSAPINRYTKQELADDGIAPFAEPRGCYKLDTGVGTIMLRFNHNILSTANCSARAECLCRINVCHYQEARYHDPGYYHNTKDAECYSCADGIGTHTCNADRVCGWAACDDGSDATYGDYCRIGETTCSGNFCNMTGVVGIVPGSCTDCDGSTWMQTGTSCSNATCLPAHHNFVKGVGCSLESSGSSRSTRFIVGSIIIASMLTFTV